jgi:hypothetical protein
MKEDTRSESGRTKPTPSGGANDSSGKAAYEHANTVTTKRKERTYGLIQYQRSAGV